MDAMRPVEKGGVEKEISVERRSEKLFNGEAVNPWMQRLKNIWRGSGLSI
jgi:hypothetical protein